MPPKWLKNDGLRIWKRLAPTLQAAKLLTQADSETFGRYCRNFALWLRLRDEIDREGATYEAETYVAAVKEGDGGSSTKLKRAHPAFILADRLERQLLATEDRFGLNPAERQRIFVVRAQTGATGDLFSPNAKPSAAKREGDPAAQPVSPAEPIDGPVGMLN
jgi:P27 family predicted phage terminase small subunit